MMTTQTYRDESTGAHAKTPRVDLAFWLVKIAATTLGETGGDFVSMSLGAGYLTGSAGFGLAFIVLVALQIRAKTYAAWLYWTTIVATTMFGTTLADFFDRSLGIGYAGGTSVLLALLAASLIAWKRTLGRIDVSVSSPRAEAFYWTTIMCSQTLGTALGDWLADTRGFGYGASAAIFGGAIAVTALLSLRRSVPRSLVFWSAFVLTRPLGAVVGDLLDKPVSHGGLALDRLQASLVLAAFMAALLLARRRRTIP